MRADSNIFSNRISSSTWCLKVTFRVSSFWSRSDLTGLADGDSDSLLLEAGFFLAENFSLSPV